MARDMRRLVIGSDHANRPERGKRTVAHCRRDNHLQFDPRNTEVLAAVCSTRLQGSLDILASALATPPHYRVATAGDQTRTLHASVRGTATGASNRGYRAPGPESPTTIIEWIDRWRKGNRGGGRDEPAGIDPELVEKVRKAKENVRALDQFIDDQLVSGQHGSLQAQVVRGERGRERD